MQHAQQRASQRGSGVRARTPSPHPHLIAPALVPPRPRNRMPASSSTRTKPTCATPSMPPPAWVRGACRHEVSKVRPWFCVHPPQQQRAEPGTRPLTSHHQLHPLDGALGGLGQRVADEDGVGAALLGARAHGASLCRQLCNLGLHVGINVLGHPCRPGEVPMGEEVRAKPSPSWVARTSPTWCGCACGDQPGGGSARRVAAPGDASTV